MRAPANGRGPHACKTNLRGRPLTGSGRCAGSVRRPGFVEAQRLAESSAGSWNAAPVLGLIALLAKRWEPVGFDADAGERTRFETKSGG